MTILARKLADHLCSRQPVMDAFRTAHIRLASKILDDSVKSTSEAEPEWQQLLTWASVLCQSDLDSHVELALIAAIAALITTDGHTSEAHRAAVFVLESFSNTPTIELAKERGLLEPNDIPLNVPVLLRQYQRHLRHFIFDDFTGTTLPVTDFQDRIWDALTQRGDTALSAPTSAGKSFVLIRWLVQSLNHEQTGEVLAYVVPSRALISQVRQNITEVMLNYETRPRVVTLPTIFENHIPRTTVLVMTQERVERLLAVNTDLHLKTLIVDEAHKLGEGPRGVILQRVIDEALSRSSDCRVVLAVPHAENAEVLLPRISRFSNTSDIKPVISDSRPTVLQNLFWVTPIPRRSAKWLITLVRENEVGEIGELRLKTRVTGKKKQMASLAYQLGGREGGNIIFANGPGEAEEIAMLIKDLLIEETENPLEIDETVLELAQLIKENVHPAYPLSETLTAGVGVHYGDMPEISRREQERLFESGKLLFLVCTSTLLEGVNLPCRNLFIWGPRQGKGNTMDQHTFWNLAGRAGRWGREFAGNIFCINVHDKLQWPDGPPRRRFAQRVKHTGTQLLENLGKFTEFVNAVDPVLASRQSRYLEQILGELVGAKLEGRDLSSIGWARWGDQQQRGAIETIIDLVLEKITAPTDVIKRHRGINPILISHFVTYLKSLPPEQADSFMPMMPDTPDAIGTLSHNMEIIDEYLGGAFGNQKQRNLKASLTIQWIRGVPLGKIIRDRINYLSSRRNITVPREIRSTIKIINENARYLIPKYLSCYSDCVAYWFSHIDRIDLVNEIIDIQDMLESGVAERTMISLVALGLSRTAAVEVARHIPNSELSVEGVIEWLRGRSLMVYGISPVIIREVERALRSTDFL